MRPLAKKIAQDHRAAATTQGALRLGRRVVHSHEVEEGISPADENLTIQSATTPSSLEGDVGPSATAPHTAVTPSPLDLPPDQFRAGLDRRKQNRQLLMEWLRTALVEGVDYGRIHVASRDRCQYARSGRAKECPDASHWSKPSLFKPGAEKITGMLGMTVHYPSLAAYEAAFLSLTSAEISVVMLRCELRDVQSHVVAEGIGARNIAQDHGDINKSLKMAEKSAHIDATLRLAGLSEVFTQDIEDRQLVEDEDSASRSPSGKVTGTAKPRRSSAASPTADAQTGNAVERKEVSAVRERIAQHGFTEQRVLNWLAKSTEGEVTQLEQLTIKQCQSLLKRLDAWAADEGNEA